MNIERTQDAALVRSILCHGEIKPQIWEGDDDPIVPLHESIYHLIGREEEAAVGVIAFFPVNGITWEPHMAALPGRPGRGTELLRLGTEWMFKNTPCRKVFAKLPAYNSRVIRVFEKCQYRLEGVSPRSFKWRGHFHGQFLMGKESTCLG